MDATQPAEDYQRIIYPERAEYLRDAGTFQGYKVFLEHWSGITAYLQEAFEVLRVRRFSKALLIHGAQGCGKSVLANKLYGDYAATRAQYPQTVDVDNIWHRITGGGLGRGQVENIAAVTASSVVIQIENETTWVADAERTVDGNRDRQCIVVADNCERDYFLQGLLGISDADYLSIGRSEVALRAAANKFVALSRTVLRGCLFIFFTNDQDFALMFDHYVNAQHKGLVDIRDLRMPNDVEKEQIVRINVNRLNPFSYWHCIDRAGPEEKKELWRTLRSAETFPASFAAVDRAVRSGGKSREGKPARKCVLNVIVFSSTRDAAETLSEAAPLPGAVEDIYMGASYAIRHFKDGWGAVFGNQRAQRMLESEWNLKLVLASDAVVAALLAGAEVAKDFIDRATVYHSPGTRAVTKSAYEEDLACMDSEFQGMFGTVGNAAFWSKGSVRSHEYEARLRAMYPSYNTAQGGFLRARPDLVIEEYKPCAMMSAADDEQASINSALRRNANAVEFTAIRDFSMDKLVAYLVEQKLQNYISAVQEQ